MGHLCHFVIESSQVFSERISRVQADVKRLVVDTLWCLLVKNLCIVFLSMSWLLVTEKWGRLVYQRRMASFRVPAMYFHLSESIAPMIVIWVLTIKICSCGSRLPSNVASSGGLKLYVSWSFQISSNSGWVSVGSSESSSSGWMCCWFCWRVWTMFCSNSFCWRRFSMTTISSSLAATYSWLLLLVLVQ